MKEYKVGDTIYVKGTIEPVDDASLPYYVDFGNGNTGWIHGDDIIDELPTAEPVKPVLPEKVVLTKEQAQIVERAHVKALPATFIYNSNEKDEELLMNAYVNGYTVAKEKMYLVYLDGLVTTDGSKQYLTERDGKWFASRIMLGLHQGFTEDELKTAPEWSQQLDRVEVTDDEI